MFEEKMADRQLIRVIMRCYDVRLFFQRIYFFHIESLDIVDYSRNNYQLGNIVYERSREKGIPF